MPDQPATSPSPSAATTQAVPPTPAAALSTTAILVVGVWALFRIAFDWGAVPLEALVAAAIILAWRYQPASPASALNTPTWQYVLALVIVVTSGSWLIDDARSLVGHFSTDLIWWAAAAANALIAFMAWAAMVRIRA